MKNKKIAPTPRTDERIQTIRIENEDSCCAIYVKIGDKDYDGALIDADFACQLERELTEKTNEVAKLRRLVKDHEKFLRTQRTQSMQSRWSLK